MKTSFVATAMCGALVLSTLVTSSSLYAQEAGAAGAGASVTVRMVDAVDSASDAAGKQYHAIVSKAVDAGNGVKIPQGAAAVVTLVKGGSGWTTNLASVTVNSEAISVASSSASVTSAAQNAAGNAVNAVNNVLGGFGRRVTAPAGAAAVATGQRVVLPPGTSLVFVLSQPPASSATAPSAPAAQPAASSAQPVASPAFGMTEPSAAGSLSAMEICFSNPPPTPSDPNHKTEYLTAVFEVPIDSRGSVPAIEPAFSEYLKATYHYPNAGITCQPIWSMEDARTAQKKIAGDRDTAKLKMVNTGWRYSQPLVAQGQKGFDPLTMGAGGLDLTQHRMTTYYCTLTADGGNSQFSSDPSYANRTAYVSSIFQADWDSAAVVKAWYAHIRDVYVHDLSGATLGPGALCVAQSPAMVAMMHPQAGVSKLIHHVVPVDWTYTPGQVASSASAASTAPAAAAGTASTAPSNGGSFISCSTRGTAGVSIYVTGIFQTTLPIRHMPNGAKLVDQSILDHFHAYLTQKGYKFTPGNNQGCDVSATEAAAEVAQHTRIHGGSGSCGYCGFQVVETGWKDGQ